MSIKKCNGCKRDLALSLFERNSKTYARCNDCSRQASFKKNVCEACGIRARYNRKGESTGRFCTEHKELGMIDVISNKCEKCDKIPIYNLHGESKGRFCSEHKELGMIDVKNNKCEKCNKQPTYNVPGESKGRVCTEHKEPGMVDVKHNKCEKCDKRPNYNVPGECKGRFCTEHKEPGMINVKDNKCEKCDKIPNYNVPGECKGRFCFEHKEPGMVDVKNNKCEKCDKRPNYNVPGECKGRFCTEHKELGMVDVKHNKCEKCDKIPNYNVPGECKGIFCFEHKEPGMVDVKHNKCEKCDKRPSYGYCGQQKTHCAQHKLEYMINTSIGRLCEHDDCKESATYGTSKGPVHCEEHCLFNEFCWLAKPCVKCRRVNELLDKNGLCYFICSSEKVDCHTKTHDKIKESTMVRYLREHCKLPSSTKECLADRIVDSMCNKYRPDLAYDCGTHILVIECDEHQHKSYNWQSCASNQSLEDAEEKRMYEIFVAFGLLPTIFIRWNPDSFTVEGNVCKRYNQNKRLEILTKWVEHCMKIPVTKLSQEVKYIKLFYDKYNESDTSFKTIKYTS